MTLQKKVVCGLAAVLVLGFGYALVTPPPNVPFWIEGQAWAQPDDCPQCGRPLTRRDAEFMECVDCKLHILKQ